MDHSHSADLPPELDELGTRMSMGRPVASDCALRHAMTRAQGARGARKSLLWRSDAPRTPKKSIIAGIAAIAATASLAGAATAIHETGSPAPVCSAPVNVLVLGQIGSIDLAAVVAGLFPGLSVNVLAQVQVGDSVQLTVCINI